MRTKIFLLLFSSVSFSTSFAQYNFTEVETWSGSFPGGPSHYIFHNDSVFFQATDNYTSELWRTSKTASGTQQVLDLNGTASSSPESFFSFGNRLIFTATNTGIGREPHVWENGTATLLADVRAGSSQGVENNTNQDKELFLEFNGEIYFAGNTGNGVELWKTDGTPTGTVSVKNFTNGAYGNLRYVSTTNAERFDLGTIYNGLLYFVVNRSGAGDELWKTDGTSAGTTLVTNLIDDIRELQVFDNQLYFSGYTLAQGQELWSSDGTGPGTLIVKDIFLGMESSFVSYLTPFNGDLIFKANTGNGSELYKWSNDSLILVKEINPDSSVSAIPESGLNLPRFIEYENELYFVAESDPAVGKEIWKTNGDSAGTVPVLTFAAFGENFTWPSTAIYDDKIFFEHDDQLWTTDGTIGGTLQLTDNGNPNDPIGSVSTLKVLDNGLWFEAANLNNGQELWRLGIDQITIISTTECGSYTVPSGDETHTVSGTYFDTIPGISGGDSILQIDLVIENISAQVSQQSDTLSATGGSTYQWFDCSTQQTIQGATSPVFIPSYNGSFAVIATSGNGCSDTSSCYPVLVTDIIERELTVNAYPNPSLGRVTLQGTQPLDFDQVLLMNSLGQRVSFNYKRLSPYQIELTLPTEKGTYFLIIHTNNGELKSILLNRM